MPGVGQRVVDWRYLRGEGCSGAAGFLQAVRRLWWERVCDFWQLKWHYVKDDDSCDHLFVSASALLWWWARHQPDIERAFTNR